MKLVFYSLSSGSSGNCYYLGNEFHGILIDAGISFRSIKEYLKAINIPVHQIMGILVTHNHNDHIKSLQTLVCRHHIPVFTTETIRENILAHPFYQKIGVECIKTIPVLNEFHLAGFDVTAFPVSHDTPETVGFHIQACGRRITIVTDLGYICENASKYIQLADFLVLESNYDRNMLQNGSYPSYLKSRIISNKGHLDNCQTAGFLSENLNPDTSHICLAHLSKNNNTPQLALDALYAAFSVKGKTLNGNKPEVLVLNRDIPSPLIELV